LMHLAASEALVKGHMPVSREYRRSAHAWVRRRFQLEDNDRREWDLSEHAIAAWADAVYKDQGPATAIAFLRSWSPELIAFGAGRALLDRVVRREGPESLREWYCVTP